MKKNVFGLFLQLISIMILFAGIVLFIYVNDESGSLFLLGVSSYIVLGITIPLFLLFFSIGTIICLLADIEWNTRPKNISKNYLNVVKDSKKAKMLDEPSNLENININTTMSKKKPQKLYEKVTISIIIIGVLAILLTVLIAYVF